MATKNPALTHALLKGLVGLPVGDATKVVRFAGLQAEICPHRGAITMIARPDTVLLWVRDDIVTTAEAGDPAQMADEEPELEEPRPLPNLPETPRKDLQTCMDRLDRLLDEHAPRGVLVEAIEELLSARMVAKFIFTMEAAEGHPGMNFYRAMVLGQALDRELVSVKYTTGEAGNPPTPPKMTVALRSDPLFEPGVTALMRANIPFKGV